MKLPKQIIIFDTEYNSPKKNPEIIQIAAIKVNTKEQKIIDEFTIFVKPEIKYKLSEHIKKLTRIKQKQIDSAQNLEEATKKFKEFIGKNICYSYGDDFLVIKNNFELYNKKLPLKRKKFKDIKQVLEKENIQTQKYTSGSLIDYFGIKSELKKHNALNDSKNLATAIFQLLPNKKVLVGMSGGVDSSVAALLLKKKGYDVYGAFMKNWSDTKNKITGQCAWVEEREHALKIAAKLEIPIITLDFEDEYKELVIDKMFEKYKKGITPNPDIDCNQKIKFPMFIEEAKKRGINLIATGHYARIKKKGKKYEMHRAKDESKDQSYFLYRQNQNDLAHTIFPIGNLTKKEVRRIAKKHNFQNADKKGTVGICFVGKVNLKDFLQKKIKPKKGKILNPEGEIIGEHDGIYYYTIGQRLGPRYGFEVKRDEGTKEFKKWYVARKDAKKNIIVAAPEGHELNFRKEIIVNELHLIDEDKKQFKNKLPRRVYSRIRQVGELIPTTLTKKGNKILATLDKAITGVSEGQAIVLYDKTKVLGGGVITF